MKALVARFVREDSGQDLIEYGLLVGIITAISAGVIGNIGGRVKTFYDNLWNAIKP